MITVTDWGIQRCKTKHNFQTWYECLYTHLYHCYKLYVFCFVWQDTVALQWFLLGDFPKGHHQSSSSSSFVFIYPCLSLVFLILWWNGETIVLWVTQNKCVYLSTVKWPSWQFLLRHAAAWTLGAFVWQHLCLVFCIWKQYTSTKQWGHSMYVYWSSKEIMTIHHYIVLFL